MERYFNQDEFKPAPDQIETGLTALKALATGRSTGLTAGECTEIHGAVWQLAHYAVTAKARMDEMSMLSQIVGGSISVPKGRRPRQSSTWHDLDPYEAMLKAKCASIFNADWLEIKATSRRDLIVYRRAAIVNALLVNSIGGWTQIGRLFGKDHSTIVNARKNHEVYMKDTQYDYPKHFKVLSEWLAAIKSGVVC